MARVLIVGGGGRGRRLAQALLADGHAVRATACSADGRAALDALGAESWLGTPLRLATLRGALDSVTIACWLLGSAPGSVERLGELHGPRLELFLSQAIDTTVRGVVYEASGSVPAPLLEQGARTFERMTAFNAVPSAVLRADPGEPDAWLAAARAAITGLLADA